MRRRGNIVSGTLSEIREMLADGGDMTDWERVRAMPQEEVERLAEEEDGPVPTDGWTDLPIADLIESKQDIHIRLDARVLRWFKSQGPGYQTRINAVLDAFVKAQERAGKT